MEHILNFHLIFMQYIKNDKKRIKILANSFLFRKNNGRQEKNRIQSCSHVCSMYENYIASLLIADPRGFYLRFGVFIFTIIHRLYEIKNIYLNIKAPRADRCLPWTMKASSMTHVKLTLRKLVDVLVKCLQRKSDSPWLTNFFKREEWIEVKKKAIYTHYVSFYWMTKL